VLVDAIKTFVGSFDEETESVYLGNGTRKTQIETVPIVYSSYSSSVFRNQYNTTTTAEHSIDKDNSVVLSHRLNTKGTKHRYYIESSTGTRTDECMSTKCTNRWYCLGITETIESYKTHFVGEDRDLSIVMFLSVLNELKIVCK
jgi:hypothetical protein